MPLNWTTGDLMVPAGCLPCCIQNIPTPPTENYCQCLFYFPFSATIFANHNVASAAISTQTNNCIAYVAPSQNAFVATQATAALNVSANTAAGYQHIWASITVGTNVALNIAFNSNAVAGNNLTSITTALNVYYCNGVSFSSNTNTGAAGVAASGYFLPPVITSAAQYYLEFYTLGFTGSTAVNSAWGLSSNQNIVVNPAVALWDDSGTTRKLWACPKLLLPPLTENTGSWLADLSQAQVVNDNYVNICKVFIDPGYSKPNTEWDASSNTTALYVNNVAAVPSWFSATANSGATISIAWTDCTELSGYIYDDNGDLIETIAANSSPFVSANLPYTGRYTISPTVYEPFPGTCSGGTYTVTSSASIVFNNVQSLYDVGLTCPGRLDC